MSLRGIKIERGVARRKSHSYSYNISVLVKRVNEFKDKESVRTDYIQQLDKYIEELAKLLLKHKESREEEVRLKESLDEYMGNEVISKRRYFNGWVIKRAWEIVNDYKNEKV